MMFMPSTLLFSFVLLFSVILIISSPSWLGAWVGLEINLISFIPMILTRGVLTSIESSIKYFLVQAFSSMLMMLSILIILGGYGMAWLECPPGVLVLIVALLIKLGAAPFHYWFPAVASGVGWFQNFILMTLQKVGPLVLLGYVWGLSIFTMFLIGVSVGVGSVGGLNQSSLRKLMAYSSINHLGWLLVSSYFGLKFMLIYFVVYTLSNFSLVLLMSSMGCFYLSQVYYYDLTGVCGLVTLVNWFSFGGLPPFIGFFSSWVVINLMMDSGLLALGSLMVFMSLVSLYYYTRVCYIVLSQSMATPTVSGTGSSVYWGCLFSLVPLMGGLVFVPMFVMML